MKKKLFIVPIINYYIIYYKIHTCCAYKVYTRCSCAIEQCAEYIALVTTRVRKTYLDFIDMSLFSWRLPRNLYPINPDLCRTFAPGYLGNTAQADFKRANRYKRPPS